jgi:5-methylcytosine-specific restriction protein A
MMPMKPPVFRPAGVPTPAQSRREYEQTRKTRDPWRKWFNTKRWQTMRDAQLRSEPLCRRCAKEGRTTAATVAHHVIAHRGDAELFWCGELESACASCHSGAIQSEESSEWRR